MQDRDRFAEMMLEAFRVTREFSPVASPSPKRVPLRHRLRSIQPAWMQSLVTWVVLFFILR